MRSSTERMPHTCGDVKSIVQESIKEASDILEAIKDAMDNIESRIKEEVTCPFREALDDAVSELEDTLSEAEDLRIEIETLKKERDELIEERDQLKLRVETFTLIQYELELV